jgi:Family of unknown function (DUF6527)
MTWKLTEVDFPFAIGDGLMLRKPGEYWCIPFDYKPKLDKEQRKYIDIWREFMSDEYLASGVDYELVICLPGRVHFRASHIATNNDGSRNGWRVTGVLPNVTITPSIDVEGYYHGWITDGVIGDDLGGRTYNERGELARAAMVER